MPSCPMAERWSSCERSVVFAGKPGHSAAIVSCANDGACNLLNCDELLQPQDLYLIVFLSCSPLSVALGRIRRFFLSFFQSIWPEGRRFESGSGRSATTGRVGRSQHALL